MICLGDPNVVGTTTGTQGWVGEGDKSSRGVPKAGLAPQAGLQEACLNREGHPSKRPPRGLPKLGGDEMMMAWAR